MMKRKRWASLALAGLLLAGWAVPNLGYWMAAEEVKTVFSLDVVDATNYNPIEEGQYCLEEAPAGTDLQAGEGWSRLFLSRHPDKRSYTYTGNTAGKKFRWRAEQPCSGYALPESSVEARPGDLTQLPLPRDEKGLEAKIAKARLQLRIHLYPPEATQHWSLFSIPKPDDRLDNPRVMPVEFSHDFGWLFAPYREREDLFLANTVGSDYVRVEVTDDPKQDTQYFGDYGKFHSMEIKNGITNARGELNFEGLTFGKWYRLGYIGKKRPKSELVYIEKGPRELDYLYKDKLKPYKKLTPKSLTPDPKMVVVGPRNRNEAGTNFTYDVFYIREGDVLEILAEDFRREYGRYLRGGSAGKEDWLRLRDAMRELENNPELKKKLGADAEKIEKKLEEADKKTQGDDTEAKLAEAFKTKHAALLAKTVEAVTSEDEPAYQAAKKDFDALSEGAKALLAPEKAKLEAIGVRLAALAEERKKAEEEKRKKEEEARKKAEEEKRRREEEEAAHQSAAESFRSKFRALLNKDPQQVTLEDKPVYDEAWSAYNALKPEVRDLLKPEKAKLEAMGEKLKSLMSEEERKKEEEKRKKEEEARKKEEEKKKKEEENRKKREEEERKKKEEEARKKAEEEKRSQEEAARQAAAENYRKRFRDLFARDPETLTLEDKPVYDEAWDAYNALKPEVRDLLKPEKAKLEAMGEKLKSLMSEEERKKEEEKRKKEEESRKKEEEARKKREEEERKKKEEEARKKAEEEKRRQEEAARQAAAENYRKRFRDLFARDPETLTLEDKPVYDEAWDAYNALKPEIRDLLKPEKAKLEAMGEKLKSLMSEEERKKEEEKRKKEEETRKKEDEAAHLAAAAEFKNRFKDLLAKDLNDLTPEDKPAYEEALNAYNDLKPEVRILLEAEKAKLDAIGEHLKALMNEEKPESELTEEEKKQMEDFLRKHADILGRKPDDLQEGDGSRWTAAQGDWHLLSPAVKKQLAKHKDHLDALQKQLAMNQREESLRADREALEKAQRLLAESQKEIETMRSAVARKHEELDTAFKLYSQANAALRTPGTGGEAQKTEKEAEKLLRDKVPETGSYLEGVELERFEVLDREGKTPGGTAVQVNASLILPKEAKSGDQLKLEVPEVPFGFKESYPIFARESTEIIGDMNAEGVITLRGTRDLGGAVLRLSYNGDLRAVNHKESKPLDRKLDLYLNGKWLASAQYKQKTQKAGEATFCKMVYRKQGADKLDVQMHLWVCSPEAKPLEEGSRLRFHYPLTLQLPKELKPGTEIPVLVHKPYENAMPGAEGYYLDTVEEDLKQRKAVVERLEDGLATFRLPKLDKGERVVWGLSFGQQRMTDEEWKTQKNHFRADLLRHNPEDMAYSKASLPEPGIAATDAADASVGQPVENQRLRVTKTVKPAARDSSPKTAANTDVVLWIGGLFLGILLLSAWSSKQLILYSEVAKN